MLSTSPENIHLGPQPRPTTSLSLSHEQVMAFLTMDTMCLKAR